MASHTQIIDLFGVPACGKSTLVGSLDDGELNVKYSTLSRSYRKSSMFKQISSVPIKSLYVVFQLTSLIENKSMKHYRLRVFPMIKILICLNYAVKYSNYDRVYADHGVVQSLVSLIGGRSISSPDRFRLYATKLLNSCQNFHYVYCKINIDTAIKRMKERGWHLGRLNNIHDKERLKKEYILEEARFAWLADSIDSLNILDTSTSLNESIESLRKITYKF